MIATKETALQYKICTAAEKLTQAARYERSEARQGYCGGHYDRNLTTISGNVTLHMLRLNRVFFETAIIERYHRRESSVEEALIEMYLAVGYGVDTEEEGMTGLQKIGFKMEEPLPW